MNVPAIVEMATCPATVVAFSCHSSEPARYTGKQLQCMEFLGQTIFLPQSSRTIPHKINTRFTEKHKSTYIDIIVVVLVVVVVVALLIIIII